MNMLFQKSVKCNNVFGHREHVLARSYEWHATFFFKLVTLQVGWEKKHPGSRSTCKPTTFGPNNASAGSLSP